MKKLLAVLTLVPLLGACGGGGGGSVGPPPPPNPPCRDLGYGTAPQALAGGWDYLLQGNASTMWLYANGGFVDQHTNANYTGWWGLDGTGKLTVVYSITNECPPTGTIMTATGVTADSTRIAGTVEYSPMPIPVGTAWSIERVVSAE